LAYARVQTPSDQDGVCAHDAEALQPEIFSEETRQLPEKQSLLSNAAGAFRPFEPNDAVSQAAISQCSISDPEPLLAITSDGDSETAPRPAERMEARGVLWLVGDAEMRALLNSLGPLLKVGINAFADATSFLKAFEPDRPGCIVADAHAAGMNGLALQNELATRRCRLPLIMAIREGDVKTAVAATRGGAFDVLERPLSTDRVLECIRRSVATCSQAWNVPTDSAVIERRFERLSPREHEVLKLVVAGFTSRAIAQQLGLREKTIEAYRSHIKQKMRARNAADLVRMFHNR
jgi:two-component system response regulator FixJ